MFNVYFGKFWMTFIDIGEKIGCMSIPKCHWMVIVVNLVKHFFSFLHNAASVSGIPTSSCDNRR